MTTKKRLSGLAAVWRSWGVSERTKAPGGCPGPPFFGGLRCGGWCAVLLALGVAWVSMVGPVLAVSLGDMAKKAAGDLETVPLLLEISFYVIGATIVGFGLLKLKRHVDHPQQTTIGNGLIALGVGAALIGAPALINALGDTFGLGEATKTLIIPDFTP